MGFLPEDEFLISCMTQVIFSRNYVITISAEIMMLVMFHRLIFTSNLKWAGIWTRKRIFIYKDKQIFWKHMGQFMF